MTEVSQMTWDDIGCGFGDSLQVTTVDGKLFAGVLVDFEIDFDGSYGGDSISLKTDEHVSLSFPEKDIAEIKPL